MKKISLFLATGFGSGYFPKAPGTAGTLVAVPIYLLLESLAIFPYLGIVIAVSVVGVWICNQAEKHFDGHDHKSIVWDEIAGFLITMIAAPSGWGWIVAGFLLFRFFDILKPWPVSWADQKVEGGLGVMLDDVMAGVYAWLCLQCLAWLMCYLL